MVWRGVVTPARGASAEGAVRPASRPRTPVWLPRVSPPRIAELPPRLLSPRLKVPALPERLGAPTEPLWLGILLLRLGALPIDERLLLDERLGVLLIELRLELPLNELLERLLELEERLLLIELWLLPDERLLLTELLCPPPPLRLPPLRCARAGVALSARAIIASAITFEVFILLLLSFLVVFLIMQNAFCCVLFLLQKYNLFLGEIPKPLPIFPRASRVFRNTQVMSN